MKNISRFLVAIIALTLCVLFMPSLVEKEIGMVE